MISKEKAQLEYNAIQSLQELYSDEGDDDDAVVDDFEEQNKSKSPVFSGWDSPYKNGTKFSTAPSERKKVQRKFSESPAKGKSTLSHLSENLQRYHIQAFNMKKQFIDNQEYQPKQSQSTSQQQRQGGFSRKKFNSYTAVDQLQKEEIRSSNETKERNLDQDSTFRVAQGQISKRQEEEQQQVGNEQQQSLASQEIRRSSFRKYTEQYQCKTLQQDSNPLNSRKSSRQLMSGNKQQEPRQQANLAVSNIDLYCVEEGFHPNKDFKSTFRVVWKNRNNSLEQVIDSNYASNPQSTVSDYQRTEASSFLALNEYNYEEFLEATNKRTVMDQIPNYNGKESSTILLKNINQKQLISIIQENDPISIIDHAKIQTIFNNNDSENSTQESIRKSSKSIASKNVNTLSKQELLESQSQQQIPTDRVNLTGREERNHTQSTEEANTLISEIILPIHNRMKTEQQTRYKQTRPMSQHVNTKKMYSESTVSTSPQSNNLYQKVLNHEQNQQTAQQPIYFDNIPSYEIAHKSFKQYNIPVTLRTHSLHKRQFSSRKGSNVSNDSRFINKSINDTLLFNIYKPNQIPFIQQKINAFIQNQESTSKTQFLQSQTQESFEKQNQTIYSPLKNKNYCKYKPQIKIERQSSLNNKGNSYIDNLNSMLLLQNN